ITGIPEGGLCKIPTDRGPMDGPACVRPAASGPKGETGTTVKYQKTRKGFDTTSIGRGSAPHGGGGS
ncbi:MAG: hypothetical protein IKF22_00745, partial [Lachnospiraceae bacterium]|nr:hypothetical protein [Lachnospiraceae bacterium]